MNLRSNTTRFKTARSKTTHSKTTDSRPGNPVHGFPRHWSALDLIDAIPLRLSQRIQLGLVDFDGASGATNNPFSAPAAPQWRHRRYARAAALPTYIRVR